MSMEQVLLKMAGGIQSTRPSCEMTAIVSRCSFRRVSALQHTSTQRMNRFRRRLEERKQQSSSRQRRGENQTTHSSTTSESSSRTAEAVVPARDRLIIIFINAIISSIITVIINDIRRPAKLLYK